MKPSIAESSDVFLEWVSLWLPLPTLYWFSCFAGIGGATPGGGQVQAEDVRSWRGKKGSQAMMVGGILQPD